MTRVIFSLTDEERRQWDEAHRDPELVLCACLECDWLDIAARLMAQACPKCDGRVTDQGTALFTERLKARVGSSASR